MSSRADAHIHLFQQGYVDLLPENCRRTAPDDVTLYDALARQESIDAALVIGYEGSAAYAGNNEYLATLVGTRSWIHPTRFVADVTSLRVEQLDAWRKQGFIGISLYLFDPQLDLRAVSPEVWNWLSAKRWIISVNSKGEHWTKWTAILERHPALVLVMSHLGLPDAADQVPSSQAARERMQLANSLAVYPGVSMKVSALYALAKPGYRWPHREAWPFVECGLEVFGADRLLWGSDFCPSLEYVSFSQSCAILEEMPFLNRDDRRRIGHDNLVRLLESAGQRSQS